MARYALGLYEKAMPDDHWRKIGLRQRVRL